MSQTHAPAERGDRMACGPAGGAPHEEELWRPLHCVCVRQRQGDQPPSADREGAACQAPTRGAGGRPSVRLASLFSRTPPLPNSKALLFLLRAKQEGERSPGCWEPRDRCWEPAAGVDQSSEPQSREALLSFSIEREGEEHRKRELNRTTNRAQPSTWLWNTKDQVPGLPGLASHPPWMWPFVWPWDCTNLLSGS